MLARARSQAIVGPYTVQAAIAAEHASAPHVDATDWAAIVRWYRTLLRLQPSPVVALNAAVAVAMADGPQAGLAMVDRLDETGALERYYLLPATRADLCEDSDAARRPRPTTAGRSTWPPTRRSAGSWNAASTRSPASSASGHRSGVARLRRAS